MDSSPTIIMNMLPLTVRKSVAAALLDVSAKTIDRMIAAGDIQASRPGGKDVRVVVASMSEEVQRRIIPIVQVEI